MTSPGAPRWVLATNVVLSTLIRPGGTLGRLRLAWQHGLLVPLVDAHGIAELCRVMAYPKFRLAPEDQHDLLADYLPWTQAVALPARLPAVPACRDPDDCRFLQLARVARADAVVSGDADLLALAGAFRIPILSPAQAVEWFGC